MDKHLEGVPAGIGKYIVLRSRSIRDIERLAKDYKASLTTSDER